MYKYIHPRKKCAPVGLPSAEENSESQDPLYETLASVDKLFWLTSWQTLLASLNLTQPMEEDPGFWELTNYQLQQRQRVRIWLWDCESDPKFKSCWPVLMKNSHRVVIIFNDDIPSNLKEIKMWYSWFVQQHFLQDTQCLLVALHKPGSGSVNEACLCRHPWTSWSWYTQILRMTQKTSGWNS